MYFATICKYILPAVVEERQSARPEGSVERVVPGWMQGPGKGPGHQQHVDRAGHHV